MLTLKLLGIGSYKDELLKANLLEAITNAGIIATIHEITQIDEILEYRVRAIPALFVNDTKLSEGTVPSVAFLTDKLKENML